MSNSPHEKNIQYPENMWGGTLLYTNKCRFTQQSTILFTNKFCNFIFAKITYKPYIFRKVTSLSSCVRMIKQNLFSFNIFRWGKVKRYMTAEKCFHKMYIYSYNL